MLGNGVRNLGGKMIDHKDIVAGVYWASWGKAKEKAIATVYGNPPFLRVDIWVPSFGRTGLHVDNVNIETKPIEFIEKIEKGWK